MPTHGEVSVEGVFMLTASLDSIGGMAKSAADLSFLTELLLSNSGAHLRKNVPSILATTWRDLKVGFVDPELWQLPTSLLHHQKATGGRR